jgi:2-hydroxy-3-oxopropionate reductase
MIDRAFTPGFKARLHRKDMNIAVNAGDDVGLELAGASLVRERFDALIANGDGDRDHSALRTLYETAKPAAV